MTRKLPASALALTLATALAACSSPAPAPSAAPDTETASEPATAAAPASASPDAPQTEATPVNVLGLEGLGDLRIGQPVPKGSDWAERGAQASDACRTVTSPRYPGVYAIVEKGAVRRITAGQRSTVKLAEGIGVGASEAETRTWFAGFRETPHKYEAPPAKYLTAPNADSGDPALRFELDGKGKVSQIHVGTAPVLEYVEGCA